MIVLDPDLDPTTQVISDPDLDLTCQLSGNQIRILIGKKFWILADRKQDSDQKQLFWTCPCVYFFSFSLCP